ncbi:MAG: chorismate mutase [Azospirillum sp.]|nr:chorismate mutase [Azospirillum sp.]
MSPPKPLLEELRREIDQIDDAIHDLLVQRTRIVERIAATKTRDKNFLRPAREAMILRRLVARHTGAFPVVVLARIWRELISGLTRLQGPYSVSVFAPEDKRGFWDIARDHYGSSTPMIAVNTPSAAVRAVAEGTAAVGVVPFPADDDSDPWWRFLTADDAKTPRIVARLPFCGRGNSRSDDRDALAVSLVSYERTGDDRTLVRIELTEDLSRGRVKDLLEAAKLPPINFCSWLGSGASAGSLHLVEIADFVDAKDPRLTVVASRLGDTLIRINTIGGYAVPITLPAEPRKS